MKEDAIKCKNVSLLSLKKIIKKNSVHKTLNYILMNTIHICLPPNTHSPPRVKQILFWTKLDVETEEKKPHINYNAKLTDPLQKNGKDHVQHTL